MKNKGEHVNAALRILRISGITKQPSGDELADALETLEDMMNSLGETIDTNWNKENTPNASTPSGIDDAHNETVAWNLAIRLVDSYGKAESPRMQKMATAGLHKWMRSTSKIAPTTQPSTMPVGSGNQIFDYYYDNFFNSDKVSVNGLTETANKGDTVTTKLYFDFDIASAVVTATNGTTINSQTIDGSEIELNLSFTRAGFMTIKIVATEDVAVNPKVSATDKVYAVGDINV